jgi:predicted phage-related endonuclease
MALLQIAEHSPEWHAIRLQNIGGSEIAGLFGVQADYQQSAYTLHMVKSGRIPAPPVDDSPGSRVWFGTQLEPVIAAMAAKIHGWKISKGGYCLDDWVGGMACSLDYIIDEPGPEERKLGFTGPGVLQLKNVDQAQHKQKWVENEPPFPVLVQLQHEIACAGVTWGVIAGLVGGNNLPAYRYEERQKTIELIRQRVGEFWQNVEAKKPPHVDGKDSTAAALAALYPTLADLLPIDLSNDNELPEICAGLLVASADVKGAKAIEQEYKNRLAEKMTGHRKAFCNGYSISGVFTPENKGTRAGDLPPKQIIGARKSSIWHRVTELIFGVAA